MWTKCVDKHNHKMLYYIQYVGRPISNFLFDDANMPAIFFRNGGYNMIDIEQILEKVNNKEALEFIEMVDLFIHRGLNVTDRPTFE